MADFDMKEWDAALGRLKQETPEDRAARELGERLHARALEMSAEEWAQARRTVQAMGSRERLCCWSGATAARPGMPYDDYVARNKLAHQHLSALVLAVFGMKPGDAAGKAPTLPGDL